jgi:hypothetical protein
LQKNYLNTEVVVLIIQFIQARNKARNHNSNYLKPKNSQKYFFLSQPKVPKFEAKGARAYSQRVSVGVVLTKSFWTQFCIIKH